MARDGHRAAWDDWAHADPLWAVLSAPETKHGRWDLERFFATGEEHVATILDLAGHYGRPARHRTALDFGCGVGRITRALAPHFEHTIGLDVAPGMIAKARELDAGASGARFRVHEGDDLSDVVSGTIDFLSCVLVLQHLDSRDEMVRYLGEFVRVLAPGGVAFVQLPVHVPPAPHRSWLQRRLRLRTRAGRALRALGVSPRFLYDVLHWQPEMTMIDLPYNAAVTAFERAGGDVLHVTDEKTEPGGVVSRDYFVVPRLSVKDARTPPSPT